MVTVQLCDPEESSLHTLALDAELFLAMAAVRKPCEAVTSVTKTPCNNDVECHAVMQNSLTRLGKKWYASAGLARIFTCLNTAAGVGLWPTCPCASGASSPSLASAACSLGHEQTYILCRCFLWAIAPHFWIVVCLLAKLKLSMVILLCFLKLQKAWQCVPLRASRLLSVVKITMLYKAWPIGMPWSRNWSSACA